MKSLKNGKVIKKGIKPSTKIKLDEYNIKTYPIKKNSENDIRIEINGNLNINAPVRKNTKIGEQKVFYDDKCISEIDILTNENIREKTVFDYIYEMIKDYNKYLKRAVEN